MPVVEIRKQGVTPLIEVVAKKDEYEVKAQNDEGGGGWERSYSQPLKDYKIYRAAVTQ